MELIIQTPGNRTAQTKGQQHAPQAHAQRNPPIGHEEVHIDLQSNKEEEEHQAQVSHEIEIGVRCCGEDGLLESRNAHHHGGAENDAAEDFGDDARLTELRERPVQEATEDYNDSCLCEKSVGSSGQGYNTDFRILICLAESGLYPALARIAHARALEKFAIIMDSSIVPG